MPLPVLARRRVPGHGPVAARAGRAAGESTRSRRRPWRRRPRRRRRHGGTGAGGPGTGGPGAGGTVQLEAGRLFLVGDPKQAIYRFRGADLRVYEAARARLGATALELTTSFRAVPGIIEFVNATFAGLMGDRFAPLQVDRESTGAPSPVRIVGGALENVSAAERRHAEGDAVTDVILSAIGDPGWIIADESDGALRSARGSPTSPSSSRAGPASTSSRMPSTSGTSATGSRASRSSTTRRRSAICSRSPAPSTTPATRRRSPRPFAPRPSGAVTTICSSSGALAVRSALRP